MAESIDSESLRRVMARYYDVMRGAVERHGGSVEKFLGDAVLGVFGIPVLHEDDALRAVRAAAEMRDAVGPLNHELQQRWGVQLQVRIGVNTGEVVAGGHTAGPGFVVGDTFNVAARFEQNAKPGEVIMGESTYRLVRDVVRTQPVERLVLKGKRQPLRAFRLLEVSESVRTGTTPVGTSLVGREEQLGYLRGTLQHALSGASEFVTVIGAAGVGKSRLVQELVSEVGEAAVIAQGRCLPYGDGVTFWPVAEVVRQAAEIGDAASSDETLRQLRRQLGVEPGAVRAADALVAVLGLSRRDPNVEETFLAVRLLLETVARARSLLVVFDDVQWGATTFLDLLEYLRNNARGHGLLVLCMARPELNDVRPALTEAGEVLTVGSLDDESSVLLIEQMLHASLPPEVSRRVVEAAEGNPLFVEELIRMLIDDGTLGKENGAWKALRPIEDFTVPPTIQAILGARLDRLEQSERIVIETASVIGETFSGAALRELCSESVQGDLEDELQALERKGLIRAWSATDVQDEDSFRFGHVLIRDAAYAGLLKEARSEVHERLAGWLERTTTGSTYEEIIGFHLEQAYRHRSELGPLDQPALELASRASGYLASAGRRASARGDISAAEDLLSRALSLLPPDDRSRSALALDLAEVRYDLGKFNDADELIEEAIDASQLHRQSAPLYRSSFLRLKLRLITDPEGIADEARRELEQAIPALERVKDERSLARALLLRADLDNWACRCAEMEASARRGLEYARRSGDERAEADLLFQLLIALQMGPTPVAQVIAEAEALLTEAEGRPNVEGVALGTLGLSCAMLGDFDEARELSNRAKALLAEFRGELTLAAGAPQVDAEIELLADNPAAAERELRTGYQRLKKMGERSFLSTIAALLSRAQHALGKAAEAERLSQEAEETAASDDVASQILWRTARARILAGRQQLGEAERLARAAVSLAEDIDAYFRADAFVVLGEVYCARAHPDKAGDLIQRGLVVYEAKGNVVAAQKTRLLLERLS